MYEPLRNQQVEIEVRELETRRELLFVFVASLSSFLDEETLAKRNMKNPTDYESVNHTNIGEEIVGDFFSPSSFKVKTYPNIQKFNYEGLKGRCLSSSYMPNEGSPGYESLVGDSKRIFDMYQENGVVTIDYETKIYYGQLEQ